MPNTRRWCRPGFAGLFAPSAVSQDARSQAEAVLACRWRRGVGGGRDPAGCGDRRFRQRAGVRFLFHRVAGGRGRGAGPVGRHARQLALQTFFGAAKLALESSEEPAMLRQRVTPRAAPPSAVLQNSTRQRSKLAITQAVAAASRRSAELGDELGRLA